MYNPYAVLRLPLSASDKEIAKRYRELASHWHPDRNTAANAATMFHDIKEAYLLLSNKTTKKSIDEALKHSYIENTQETATNIIDELFRRVSEKSNAHH
jgi:curved DNA-binding protein CbpA